MGDAPLPRCRAAPSPPPPRPQAELETILFSVMRSKGFGDEFVHRYRMVNHFFQQKRPLIILICGSACTGGRAGRCWLVLAWCWPGAGLALARRRRAPCMETAVGTWAGCGGAEGGGRVNLSRLFMRRGAGGWRADEPARAALPVARRPPP